MKWDLQRFKMTETFCVCPILSQISLVTFIIENSPKILREDLVLVWYETSLFYPPRVKSSCSQNMPTNIRNMKETEHGLGIILLLEFASEF